MGDGRLLSTSDVNIMYKSYGYHPPIYWAADRNRTYYLLITNQLLYQMSYSGQLYFIGYNSSLSYFIL